MKRFLVCLVIILWASFAMAATKTVVVNSSYQSNGAPTLWTNLTGNGSQAQEDSKSSSIDVAIDIDTECPLTESLNLGLQGDEESMDFMLIKRARF
jgi:carbonic anhydrase